MLLLLAAVATACTGSGEQAVAISDIPVYEGATALEPGGSPIADILSTSIQGALGGEGLKSAINLYTLPKDATWDQVKAFYTEKMTSGDWQTSPEVTVETGAFNTVGWKRGDAANEQILVVGLSPDPLSGDSYLMLALFSE